MQSFDISVRFWDTLDSVFFEDTNTRLNYYKENFSGKREKEQSFEIHKILVYTTLHINILQKSNDP